MLMNACPPNWVISPTLASHVQQEFGDNLLVLDGGDENKQLNHVCVPDAQLAYDEKINKLRWEQAQAEAHKRWAQQHGRQEETWEEVKSRVQYAWHKVKAEYHEATA
jgi:broad specificity phosphatase PhoE